MDLWIVRTRDDNCKWHIHPPCLIATNISPLTSTTISFYPYGGSTPLYLSLEEDSIFYISILKETREYGGYYNMTVNEAICPGLDTCAEAGTIDQLPFVSLLSYICNNNEFVSLDLT